jgi:hypothetical protein
VKILVTSTKHLFYNSVGTVTSYDGTSGEFVASFGKVGHVPVNERECKIVGWSDDDKKESVWTRCFL